MKQFICPVCNQSDVVKENDLFVCQGCGTKYHADDVKKNLSGLDGIPDSPYFPTENSDVTVPQETVLARSTNITNKINGWEKSQRINAYLGTAAPAIFFFAAPFYAVIDGVKISELSEKHPLLSTFSMSCAIIFFILFFLANKKVQKNNVIANQARSQATKESITVTNTKIYGYDANHSFSIPLRKIQKIYTLASESKSSSKINNNKLCVVCEDETLCFDYLENFSEIIAAVNSVILPR